MLSAVLSWRNSAGCVTATAEDGSADCAEAELDGPSEAIESASRSTRVVIDDDDDGRFRGILEGQSSCLLEVAIGVLSPETPAKIAQSH